MPSPQSAHTARTIAIRAALQIADRYVNLVDGYNEAAWSKGLAAHLAQHEPTAKAELDGSALDALYRGLVDAAIQSTRGADADSNITTLKDLQRWKKRVQRDQRIVQVPQPDGAFVSKRLHMATPTELEALARYYERSSQADARRARYYRECATQMRLAGLADTDPLSKLLAS